MNEIEKNWIEIQKKLNESTLDPLYYEKLIEYENKERFILRGFYDNVVVPFFHQGEEQKIVTDLSIELTNGDLEICFEVVSTEENYISFSTQLETYLRRKGGLNEEISLTILHLGADKAISKSFNILDYYNSDNPIDLFSSEFFDLTEKLMKKIKES